MDAVLVAALAWIIDMRKKRISCPRFAYFAFYVTRSTPLFPPF